MFSRLVQLPYTLLWEVSEKLIQTSEDRSAAIVNRSPEASGWVREEGAVQRSKMFQALTRAWRDISSGFDESNFISQERCKKAEKAIYQ